MKNDSSLVKKTSLTLAASILATLSAFAEPPVATVAPANPTTYLAEVCQLFRKEWPGNRTVNLICHGHSVPSGYFKTPAVDFYHAYPNLLHVGLAQRFPHAVINVIVTAIGGENAEAGAGRFEADVLTMRPDVVTIDYALNDRYLEPDQTKTLERARRAWVSMIQKAQAKGIKVILLTPTADLNAKLDDPNDPLNLHAEQVRQLAKEYRTGLVDSLAAFQDFTKTGGKLETLMSQFNHPNEQGHELVAKALLEWFP